MFFVGIVATIVPLVSTRYLPFTDLPEHVAAMATIARYGTAQNAERGIYELAFGTSPYLLYHCIGAWLTQLTNDAVEANRILLVLVAVAYPVSLGAALRALGRDVRLAIFGCMPMLGRALFVGLLPYVASVPLHFVGIALVVARVRQRRAWHDIVLALLAVTLFYSHFSALVVFVATAIALDATLSAQLTTEWNAKRWARGRAINLLFLVPLAVTALLWARAGRMTLNSESLSDPTEVGRMGLMRSLFTLPVWTFDIFRSHVDEVCAAGFWLVLIAIAVRGASVSRTRSRIDVAYVPFAIAVAVYLAMPFRVGAGLMLNVRLAPIVVLSSILAVRAPRKSETTALCAAASVVTAIYAANATVRIRAIAAHYMEGFDDLLRTIPAGAKVVTLSFDAKKHETRLQPYPFAGAYHRIRNGGVASYSFTEMHHWSVHYLPSAKPPSKRVPLWIYSPCEYRNSTDGVYYDFALVIGNINPFAPHPSGPRFAAVHKAGEFTLFAKTDAAPYAVKSASDAPCSSTTSPCCVEALEGTREP
jgi:hypothetical protein